MHLAALLVGSLSALTKSSEHWGIVGVYTAGNGTSFIRVPVNNGGQFDDKDYSTGVIYSVIYSERKVSISSRDFNT